MACLLWGPAWAGGNEYGESSRGWVWNRWGDKSQEVASCSAHTSISFLTSSSDNLGMAGLCSVLITPISLFPGCCVTQVQGPPLSEHLAVTDRSHELKTTPPSSAFLLLNIRSNSNFFPFFFWLHRTSCRIILIVSGTGD